MSVEVAECYREVMSKKSAKELARGRVLLEWGAVNRGLSSIADYEPRKLAEPHKPRSPTGMNRIHCGNFKKRPWPG